MTTTMVRQGDVLLVAIPESRARGDLVPREGGRVILAHGEATGHAHALDAEGVALYERPDGSRFLRVPATGVPVRLFHDEHEAIEIPPGTYEVRRQREYEHGGWRRVAD